MPYAAVEVKKVFVKELDYEDDYENTHSVSILGIDQEDPDEEEVWYSVGNTTQDKFGQYKCKSGLITEGAIIEFQYKENGKYKNIKGGTIDILEEGNPPEKKKPAGRGRGKAAGKSGGGRTGGTKASGNDFEAGVTVGAAINNASLLAAHGVISVEDIESTTLTLADIAVRLKARLKDKLDGKAPAKGRAKKDEDDEAEEKPKRTRRTRKAADEEKPKRTRRKAASKKEPEPEADDDFFDDDIPF